MNTKRRSAGKEFRNNQLETAYDFGLHNQDGDGMMFQPATKFYTDYAAQGGILNTERNQSSDPITKAHVVQGGYSGFGRYKKNAKKQY
jgi:hypothetical protein